MQLSKSQPFIDLAERALRDGKSDLVQLWFESSVLDPYRADPDCAILRSDSAGRLRGSAGWLVNFGIAPDDQLIHLSFAALAVIPESQRTHWLSHLVALPSGENFLRMSVNPNACIDDGPSRPW